MHIAIFIGYGLSGSGSTIYTIELAEKLVSFGIKVSLFTHETRKNTLERFGKVKVEPNIKGDSCFSVNVKKNFQIFSSSSIFIPVSYERPELDNTRNINELSDFEINRYVGWYIQWVEESTKNKPLDYILINHLNLLNLVGRHFTKKSGINFSSIVHGTAIQYTLKNNEHLCEKISKALDYCSKIIVLNDSVKSEMISIFPNHETKSEIIPPGVDINTFHLKEGVIPDEQVYYAGRITMDKGLHCLLAAIPFIVEKNKELKFIISGKGPDEEVLKRAWEILSGGDCDEFLRITTSYLKSTRDEVLSDILCNPLVEFFKSIEKRKYPCVDSECLVWKGESNREEISKLINASRFSVLPSIVSEAHPLFIWETLASGRLAVGIDKAGIKHILELVERIYPELKGLLKVSNNDKNLISELILKINNLLEFDISKESMLSLSDYIKDHFSWDSISHSIINNNNLKIRRV